MKPMNPGAKKTPGALQETLRRRRKARKVAGAPERDVSPPSGPPRRRRTNMA